MLKKFISKLTNKKKDTKLEIKCPNKGVTRRKIVLPTKFQESLIERQVRFEKGEISIELIRELLYLYSVSLPC